MLKTFFENHIKNKSFTLFISGEVYTKRNKFIGKIIFGHNKIENPTEPQTNTLNKTFDTQEILIEKDGSVQSTIRMGKFLIGRKDPDYIKFIVMKYNFWGLFCSA